MPAARWGLGEHRRGARMAERRMRRLVAAMAAAAVTAGLAGAVPMAAPSS